MSVSSWFCCKFTRREIASFQLKPLQILLRVGLKIAPLPPFIESSTGEKERVKTPMVYHQKPVNGGRSVCILQAAIHAHLYVIVVLAISFAC